MDKSNFNDVIFAHKRKVNVETNELREKGRAARMLGMDRLADDIQFCCDILDGSADDLCGAWMTHIKADTDNINESIGETLKAIGDTLPD